MRQLLLLLILSATPAFAWNDQVQRTTAYDLPSGSTVTGQLFLLADQATFSGVTEDDVFVLTSGPAQFSGESKADAWVLAGQSMLLGHMMDHVRVAGQSVMVGGLLERSLLAVGSTVHLTTSAVVRGDTVLVGENVVLEGAMGGSVHVVAQSVTISGTLDGPLRLYAQDIVIMPGTVVVGDVLYTSPKEIFLDSRVHLGGQLKKVEMAEGDQPTAHITLAAVIMTVLKMMGALVVGIPFALLFPHLISRATRLVRFNLLRSMLTGFIVFFVLPFLIIGVAFTIIGLPLVIITGGLAAALLYLGKIVVALVLGGLILRRRGAQSIAVVTGAMALGLVLLYILFLLPVLGSSLALLVAMVGSGALWWAMLGGASRREATPPPVPPETETTL